MPSSLKLKTGAAGSSSGVFGKFFAKTAMRLSQMYRASVEARDAGSRLSEVTARIKAMPEIPSKPVSPAEPKSAPKTSPPPKTPPVQPPNAKAMLPPSGPSRRVLQATLIL